MRPAENAVIPISTSKAASEALYSVRHLGSKVAMFGRLMRQGGAGRAWRRAGRAPGRARRPSAGP